MCHRVLGLMAILDRALLRLERVQETIGESSLPALDSARDVTRKISRLVRDELDSILGDVELETEVEPNEIVAGTENEVEVRVKKPIASCAPQRLGLYVTLGRRDSYRLSR